MSKLISPEECKELYLIVAEDVAAQIKNQYEFQAALLGIKYTSFKASLDEEGNLHTTFRASWTITQSPEP